MKLSGEITPPGDKSISHRMGLFSLLGRGTVRVRGYSPAADCTSTLNAVTALGGEVVRDDGIITITGAGGDLRSGVNIDCGNSGTTMRLLMGICAGINGKVTLDGDESLRKRPMERVAGPLRQMGAEVTCAHGGAPPVKISGGSLTGGRFDLPVASAQLKSALLLAGLKASGPTTVISPAASRDHTERMFKAWGVDIDFDDFRATVKPGLMNLPEEFVVPADASAAAFFCCGAAIIPGSRVTAKSTLLNPGRIGWVKVLERMGAHLVIELAGSEPEPWGDITVEYTPDMQGVEVLAEDIAGLVDEVPVLALAATQCKGSTIFRDVGELRVKESDRLAAIVSQLGRMGADVREDGDDLVVNGPTPLSLPEGLMHSFGDHRIAMTIKLAGIMAGADADLDDPYCMAISHPGFEVDLDALIK